VPFFFEGGEDISFTCDKKKRRGIQGVLNRLGSMFGEKGG